MRKSVKALVPALVVAGIAAIVPSSASAQLAPVDASPGSASAAALDLPGLVTLNKSESSTEGSKVTQLSALGIELLGYQNGGSTGALAPVGDLVRTINDTLCSEGGATTELGCLGILVANTENTNAGGAEVNSASASLLSLDSPGDGLNLAGSAAFSGNADGQCVDGAVGYLLITKKVFNGPQFQRATPLYTKDSSSGDCPPAP